MKQISLQRETLEVLSELISEMFTHSEITNLFLQHKYKNICSEGNKFVRVYNTFASEYNSRQDVAVILNVIFSVINPVQFATQEAYEDLLYKINTALAHDGLRLSFNNGNKKVHIIKKARDINDAKSKASQLRHILESRGIHPYVLRFCKSELLQDNYFHAVLEASKSIYSRIRKLSYLYEDGNKLIDIAFSTKNPILKINPLETQSDISEQIGFMNLIKGTTSMFRNPTAHEAKIYWAISKEEAIDLLTIISFIHKKLDKAKLVQ